MKSEFKSEKVLTALSGYLGLCSEQPEWQRQHLSGAGPVFFLEKRLSKFYNKKFAVTFCNATTALLSLAVAMELSDAEIITSPVNWGGSVAPFLFNQNKLYFTAINSASLNMDSDDLKSALNQNSKAVLSVDYNGNTVDSSVIKKFCRKNNLKYISDSSQSLGSFYNGKPAGYDADAIVLSFSPGKTFFAGEGGAVITNDEDLYEKLLWFSQHPERQKGALGISNYNEYAPINGRMNPLSAIFLNETFESSWNTLKTYQALCYNILTNLAETKLIKEIPHIVSAISSTFNNFSLLLNHSVHISQVNVWLATNNLPFRAEEYFPKLIPYDSVFREQFKGKFKCTDKLQDQKQFLSSQNRIILRELHKKIVI